MVADARRPDVTRSTYLADGSNSSSGSDPVDRVAFHVLDGRLGHVEVHRDAAHGVVIAERDEVFGVLVGREGALGEDEAVLLPGVRDVAHHDRLVVTWQVLAHALEGEREVAVLEHVRLEDALVARHDAGGRQDAVPRDAVAGFLLDGGFVNNLVNRSDFSLNRHEQPPSPRAGEPSRRRCRASGP